MVKRMRRDGRSSPHTDTIIKLNLAVLLAQMSKRDNALLLL